MENLNRRVFLSNAGLATATVGLPVAALAAPPWPGETPIMRLYREHQALTERLDDHATTSAEFDESYPHLRVMEDAISEEPLTCLADLAAKVLVLTQIGDTDDSIWTPALREEMRALVAA